MMQNTRYKIRNAKQGFSLVEVLLTVAIFVLIFSALVGALIYGRESSFLAGERGKAVMLAEEGLEAARSIRDGDFSLLAAGTYGLAITDNKWRFSGSSDAVDNFTREIEIASGGDDRRTVTSTVTWQQNEQRIGTVSAVTYLHNLWDVKSMPSCSVYCQDEGYDEGACRENTGQCSVNGEVYESGGDDDCTGGPSMDTCCCVPEINFDTCAEYCQYHGYSGGTCRQVVGSCDLNGENYESGGDIYCTGGPSSDTCCCAP
ncbi:prepilin-type N-terminal cleavage/methylation domain-containing protein [Patescibacteria group bacterium]